MNQKNNKGITLIALVITIIVLLILAGVTINMVLGDDGIIVQAQDASKANEDASLKDAVEISKGEAALNSYISQTPMTKEELEALKDDENKQIFDFGENEYKNTVAKVVDGVPIPVGFAYVEGTKKDTGLIITDKYGNEFVWVPVGENGTDNWQAPGVEPNDAGVLDNSINTDFDTMKTSVGIYKGFYVGRYETSYNGTRVASIGNVEPLHYTEDNQTTWYTFYTKQKELYNKTTDSVVSGMIYDGQWNAIMTWMEKVPNNDPSITDSTKKFYTKNSTGMGNYGTKYDCNNDQDCIDGFCDRCGGYGYYIEECLPIKTGSNPDYKVKNIYDLAGNYEEWTQRTNALSRSVRGGSFRYEHGHDHGEGMRSAEHYGYNNMDYPNENTSSRLQLYIK